MISTKDALLSPLDLRVRDILVQFDPYEKDQLVWKSWASTYVGNLKDAYHGIDYFTVKNSIVYLVIIDKPDGGTAEQVILDASAHEDIEIIIRKAGLPCSRLPADLSVDSPEPEFRRAVINVIGKEPRELFEIMKIGLHLLVNIIMTSLPLVVSEAIMTTFNKELRKRPRINDYDPASYKIIDWDKIMITQKRDLLRQAKLERKASGKHAVKIGIGGTSE